MASRWIINADDFGFSRGVTDGILRCHREGVLTSTTLMTTMGDKDRAIDLAGETPSLGVGIHLCLTQGEPLTKCGRLLDRQGAFVRSLPKLFWKLRTRAAREEAREEFAAQIGYAVRRGLRPTHVDSHKHVGHYPGLHEAMIQACGAMGIGWVRCAREVRLPKMGWGGGGGRMAMGYRMQASFARALAKKVEAAGLRTTDWFFGLATTGQTTASVLEALAGRSPEGLGEIMVHPGFVGDVTERETRLLRERVVEMEALCDGGVRGAIQEAGVVLARYGCG